MTQVLTLIVFIAGAIVGWVYWDKIVETIRKVLPK